MFLKAQKMKNCTLGQPMICVEDFPNTTKEQSLLPKLADLLSHGIMSHMFQKKTQEVESFLSRKMAKLSVNSNDGFRQVFYEMKGVGV